VVHQECNLPSSYLTTGLRLWLGIGIGLAELSPKRKRLASSVSLSDRRSSSTISSVVSEVCEAVATEAAAAVQMTLNELNLRSEEQPEPATDAMAKSYFGLVSLN